VAVAVDAAAVEAVAAAVEAGGRRSMEKTL
jgi:hypothetical protein